MRQPWCPLVVLCACAVAGCSQTVASGNQRVEPSGEFRVLMPAAPSTLNPNLDLDEAAYLVGRSIFSQLLTINETGRLLPDLAQTWTASSDGLTYTFALRRGVRWHDGTPFTSADVQWTFDAIARDGMARDVLAPVAAIDTPDDATVVFRLKQPWAPFVSDLAAPGTEILPAHIYRGSDWRTNPANRRPVGTGPFRFSDWRPDGSVVLAANSTYFRAGPYVQQLVFDVAAANEVLPAMTRGVAHYTVVRPPGLDLATLGPDSTVQARTLPTSARYYVAFNMRRPPFGDVRVRRALAAAIDRLELVRTAMLGRGAPAMGWYTPDVEWAYNAAARVPDFDPAEARRLLTAAGVAPGQRLRATLVVHDAPPMRDVADLLRKQLSVIGVALDIVALSIIEWPKRVITMHDFDLALVSGTQGPDPDALRRRFASTAQGDYIGYGSAAFREAVERGARAVTLDERARAYHQAQDILAADVPFIPLAEAVKIVVYHRGVSGLPQLEARGLVGSFDFSLVKLQPATPKESR